MIIMLHPEEQTIQSVRWTDPLCLKTGALLVLSIPAVPCLPSRLQQRAETFGWVSVAWSRSSDWVDMRRQLHRWWPGHDFLRPKLSGNGWVLIVSDNVSVVSALVWTDPFLGGSRRKCLQVQAHYSTSCDQQCPSPCCHRYFCYIIFNRPGGGGAHL